MVVPNKNSEANGLRHHVTLHGSVGPYLFVKVTRAESYCGVHGAVTDDFRVWDVEVGRHVDLLSEVANIGALKASAKKILDDSAEALVNALAALQVGNRWVSVEDLKRWLDRRGRQLTRDALIERLVRLTQQAPLVVEQQLTTRWFRLQVGLYARHLRYLQRTFRA